MSYQKRQQELSEIYRTIQEKMNDSLQQQYGKMMESLPQQYENALNQARTCINNGDLTGAFMHLTRAQFISSMMGP
jgi:translation initiation factor 2 alpha subunit (eIF-2alpha)